MVYTQSTLYHTCTISSENAHKIENAREKMQAKGQAGAQLSLRCTRTKNTAQLNKSFNPQDLEKFNIAITKFLIKTEMQD